MNNKLKYLFGSIAMSLFWLMNYLQDKFVEATIYHAASCILITIWWTQEDK